MAGMIPKPRRETDKQYLEYIETLPCTCKDCTCIGSVVPHHTKTKGSGGSDYLTIPLCARHHHEVHFLGRLTFQEKNNVFFQDVIPRLLIGYIKRSI